MPKIEGLLKNKRLGVSPAAKIRRAIKVENKPLVSVWSELRAAQKDDEADALWIARFLARALLKMEGGFLCRRQADLSAVRWLPSWVKFWKFCSESAVPPLVYLRVQADFAASRGRSALRNGLLSDAALNRWARWLERQQLAKGDAPAALARAESSERNPIPRLLAEWRASAEELARREVDPLNAGILDREELVFAEQLALSGPFLLLESAMLRRFERALAGDETHGLAKAVVARMTATLRRLDEPGALDALEAAADEFDAEVSSR